MTDPRVPSETLRMSAYYYSFEPTGNPTIDRILSAVACAGKAFHHTESWSEETEPYLGCVGATPLDWIQNAANDAANELRAQLAQAEPVAWMYDVANDWLNDCTQSKLTVNGWPDKSKIVPLYAALPRAEHDRLAQCNAGWRPIETAPTDGTSILLSWGGRVFQGFYLDNSKSLAPWKGFRPMSGEVTPPKTPDSWMPMPAAPESEEPEPRERQGGK